MERIVVFLGAGASKSDGAPLQKELFRAYMDSVDESGETRERYYKNNPFYKNVKSDLFAFFDVYFGINLSHSREALFPTFEEALGVLEVEGGYAGKETVRKYKDAIIASMALAIESQLDNKRSEQNYRIIDSYHKLLIENLCDRGGHQVDFLSTNYDLLADNALLSQGRPINYGFTDQGHGIRLLKLHGSMNWLYCPGCGRIQATGAAEISANNLLDFSAHKCENCGSVQTSVIIPPTYFKNFVQYGDNIRRVWENAYEALSQADRIIICGYSFPHADIHIKTLLKKSEQGRKRSTPLKVSVFNGYEGKSGEEKRKEAYRYLRFLRKDTILDYQGDIPFEEFAKSPQQYIDGTQGGTI
ncbi:SIR2 family protein [Anaerovorax odorimutans]|uniref:SIR2 family protein n=1 Tax=Anaerovorax odorimutans TaxID=109327 RepID=A0ABT1RL00_9FIRM|nr:SIR2 family protein [Anaerovorax odorimutans]MCQ4635847.1 SIR2 family protein [Anaerovorax odorimutans]